MLKKAWENFSKLNKTIYKRELDVTEKAKLKIQNPYHHNFKLNYDKERDTQKILFDMFDLARVFGAAFFIIKIGMKLPSYTFFRRTKYENNPDFMLCDQAQFEMLEKKNE